MYRYTSVSTCVVDALNPAGGRCINDTYLLNASLVTLGTDNATQMHALRIAVTKVGLYKLNSVAPCLKATGKPLYP